MGLEQERTGYKPFAYPWCHEAWKTQQRLHWLPEEVPLGEDVKDWNALNPIERNLVTHIFRFFTQSDIEVNGAYTKYQRIFKPIEVLMMLQAFQNIETIHIEAYSYLLDTIGMPETEYSTFMGYKAMREKHEYLQSFSVDNPYQVALTMAAFFAFVEGMALFASFVILLNFPRHNKMRGMGQIITWSVRDETLHSIMGSQLFKTYLEEHPEIDREKLQDDIYMVCLESVTHEDAFIDLAFEMGAVEGLTPEDVKSYIRFIANRRLNILGYDAFFDIEENPLPWVDDMLNANEHANFFENRSTEYSRASTTGTWEDAFDDNPNRPISA